jgi:hypothetical protein
MCASSRISILPDECAKFEAGPAFCNLNGTVIECIAAAEMALEWNGFVSCTERKGDR